MNDLIRREDAIDALKKYEELESNNFTDTSPISMMTVATIANCIEEIVNLPSAKPERKWIPFTMRELTKEEKEEHPEWNYIVDCILPDDGEEILVSNGKFIWSDTFVNDGDGCYLDSDTELDGCAWMPLPEPWRGK